jgi:hypothetical protein
MVICSLAFFVVMDVYVKMTTKALFLYYTYPMYYMKQ